MSEEEQLEEYGEALRQIYMLITGEDPSDGEGTSGAEVLETVKSAFKTKDELLLKAAEMLNDGTELATERQSLSDQINGHLWDSAGNK